MVKKVFSSVLAIVMLFLCVPMVAQALPEDIVLEQHGADGDTSNTASDYWVGGNEVWTDKSVFDNGDGSMNVVISVQARQVNGDPDGEPVGAVIDGSLTVNDSLGNGFSFGDSISVSMGETYTYSLSGGWSSAEPDGVSVSVSGNNLSVNIDGSALLTAGGTASISYVANLSATEAGTYYVSDGCVVMATGAMADRSDIFTKTDDVVKDGNSACEVEISGGRLTSTLGNNGYVTISKVVYYTDSYEYSGDYPSDVMSTLPSGGTSYVAGSTAVAVAPSASSVRGERDGLAGTWLFDGWDANEKPVNGDVVFVGTWSFDPDPIAYHEFYEYTGVTDENVLVTLPDRSEAYYNGNTVTPAMPSAEVVMTDDGTYIFNGWSPESVIISDGDAKFVGSWLFEPKPEPEPEPEPTVIHVIYEYTGVTADEVLRTLPSDNTEYTDGADITAILPNPAIIETDAGVWTFDGWTRTDGENVVFTGTWTFTAKVAPEPEPEPVVAMWHVVYQYDGVTDEAVLATLPRDDTEYDSFESLMASHPVTVSPASVVTDEGTWMFDAWSRVDGENIVTFTGTWTFVEKQVEEPVEPEPTATYTVQYEYSDVQDADVLATLPSDSKTYSSVDAISAIDPMVNPVVTTTGSWSFNGWTQWVEDTVVKFIGTWTFTAKTEEPPVEEPPTGIRVVYQYSGVTDDAVLATLPVDNTEYASLDAVQSVAPSVIRVTTDAGIWDFDGWTRSDGENVVTFVGSWVFTENTSPDPESPKTYHVVYQYADVTDSAVLATLPVDESDYEAGELILPATPTAMSVETASGTWTFSCWDVDSILIEDSDAIFTGTWSFQAKPAPAEVHYVIYTYADVTDSEVWRTLPEDETAYEVSAQINAMQPTTTEVVTSTGTWTFVGWDADAKVMDHEDLTFVGTWQFTPNGSEQENPPVNPDQPPVTGKYHVSYSYKDVTDVDVLETLPVDTDEYTSGTSVVPESPSSTLIIQDAGMWSFSGWDANMKIIGNEDIQFIGSWSFIANEPEYQVVYQYLNADSLPADVRHTLPSDSHRYKAGTTVVALMPSADSVQVGDDLWQFGGWNSDSQQVVDSDIVFIGSWSIYVEPEPEPQPDPEPEPEPDPEPQPQPDPDVTYYGVHYMYSGSVGEAVLATLPDIIGAYKNGDHVTPVAPKATEVAVSGGKWVFVGWDATEKIVDNSDVTFYGEWSFVSVVAHFTEHYEYEGVTDPDVLETLPQGGNAYENGVQVFPVNPSSEIVITDAGTWSFIGWTPTVATIKNGDVTFYGKWDFVAKEIPTYSEEYQYADVTDEAVLATLPTREGKYYAGDSVIPAQPSATVVETEDGIYTFAGWDVASRVVTDRNVVFTGTWTFEPKEHPTKYSEEYAYANVDEPLVVATLPTRAEWYDIGVLVIPADPSATIISTDKGTWTFNGWDVAGRVVIDKNVVFVGTWTFKAKEEEPVPPPTVYYEESYQYEGELPDEVMATLPLRAGSYVPGDVVVPAMPSATTVTLAHGVWTFVGWNVESFTIVDSDVAFVGTWSFTEQELPPEPPVTYYAEHYEYDKEYPEDIMATLPTRHGKYLEGDEVEAATPSVTSITGTKDGVDGTWTFGGWDASKKVVGKEDITFIGTWSFTPSGSHQRYTEFYKYDMEYPPAVMTTLPLSARMFENGTVVIPANPTASLIEGELDGKIGVWKFNGWDEEQKIVNNAAVIFVGSWTFEPEASYLTDVKLSVVWIDDNNATGIRPESVPVKLLSDGEELLSVDLTSAQGYQAVFEGLPAKKDNVYIDYSVVQATPDGYTLSLSVKYVESTLDKPGSIEFIMTNTIADQGIALPETGSMNAIWLMLGGMLLVGVGILVFRPKRKHE